jgi:hypothetical protein
MNTPYNTPPKSRKNGFSVLLIRTQRSVIAAMESAQTADTMVIPRKSQ